MSKFIRFITCSFFYLLFGLATFYILYGGYAVAMLDPVFFVVVVGFWWAYLFWYMLLSFLIIAAALLVVMFGWCLYDKWSDKWRRYRNNSNLRTYYYDNRT